MPLWAEGDDCGELAACAVSVQRSAPMAGQAGTGAACLHFNSSASLIGLLLAHRPTSQDFACCWGADSRLIRGSDDKDRLEDEAGQPLLRIR